MGDHITRYDRMPIPPILANTEFFEAGPIRIGVEFRVLTDDVVAAIRATLPAAIGAETGKLEDLDDTGVSFHVYGNRDGQAFEFLRFDCFREDPHYHYVGWDRSSNEVLHLDPVADGDPVAWALDRIGSRLPQMLIRAGAADVAATVDLAAIEAILPRVTEAAYRLRYQDEATTASPTAA